MTTLFPIRPLTPEPELRAADLADPVGPLAAPSHLKLEQYLPGDVLGGAAAAPRLSWEIATAPAGWKATGAELEVTRTDAAGTPLAAPEVLPLAAADGVLAAWPAQPLTSRERVVLRVRVSGAAADDDQASATPWSSPVAYEVGLLEPSDWQALPVGPAWPENPLADRRPPRVRREFTLEAPVVAARAYVSAHGLIRAEIDGQRVGADELVPGWTVYGSRIVARAYDVTELLTARGDGSSTHAVGAQLADGWYRGHIGFDGGYRNLYGDDVAALIQLEVTLADGTRQVIATDSSWKAGVGEILFTDLYDGEKVDARLATPGWSAPGFDESGWWPVTVGASDAERLVMPSDAPVRATEVLRPVEVTVMERRTADLGGKVIEISPERLLVDFGQNVSGRVRIQVSGAAGQSVTIRHAEVLDGGELGMRTLREAEATDVYTLRGDGLEEWEPAFAIHGFRYVDVTGWPGGAAEAKAAIESGALLAVVLHTQMERLGAFAASDERVTRLHENSRWSMRDNFVSIPTDCPQRDERLGWTGDIQAFAPTAAFHYSCTGLLSSWLKDLAIEQDAHGTVPWYVPVIPGGFWTPPTPAAVWGDAATVVPWELYRATGDTGVLRQQYDSAKDWVDLVDSLADEDHVWDCSMQLGDWLDPSAPPEDPMQAMTDPHLVATAFFAHSTRILAQWAEVLGEQEDARHYDQLADAIGEGFRARYTDGTGLLSSDTQTAYALTIAFDLAGDEERRVVAGRRLAELVEVSGGHVATGFAGTPVLTGALSATGHADEAYRLLMETSCPSWLYAITMGATTTWERWDSMLPDGSINPGGMTSFNHYALGAVAAWLEQVVGGLAPAEPGYRVIEVAPQPGGGLSWAESVHRTPLGWAASSWRTDDDGALSLDVVVPVGATARVSLPGGQSVLLEHGRHHLSA
ncbi:alpha-L-rhamnosidase [Actinomyces faecalis]|uniref:alpha-L-rhamnosidase n=1 Tax=Actinomyces faecalis TaxID=2722820 RepID=UPI0015561AC2|nr:alpha-L-rhamnosidase [Actinomyces faecalis]